MRAKEVLTIGTCLTVIGLVLVSCAPAAPASTPTAPAAAAKTMETPRPAPSAPSPTSAAPTTPRYGGELSATIAAEPASLDIQQESSLITVQLVGPAYNSLLEFNPQGGIDSILAEKWQVSNDGKLYTFTIRDGITWHDGKPFTTDDVAWNIERLAKPPQGIRSNVKDYLGPITKVTKVDAKQFTVAMEAPSAAFLAGLATHQAAFIPPQVVAQKGSMKNDVLGTGPFSFKNYNPGVSMQLFKNPAYFVKGRPYLDAITWYIIKDSATRLAALRTGRVQMTGRLNSALAVTEVDLLKKEQASFKFLVSPSVSQLWLFFNRRAAPFSDKQARQAVTMAIDRDLAVSVAMSGAGGPGRAIPIPGWGLSDEELSKVPGWRKPKEQDITEAKKLLQEAGYPSGFPVTINVRSMARDVRVAEFLTDQLSRIGISASLKVQDTAVFWDELTSGRHMTAVYAPSRVIPDVDSYARFFIPKGNMNYSGNDDDKRLEEQWKLQSRTLEVDKRKAILKEVERYLLEEDVTVAPVVETYPYIALNLQVQGFEAGITDYAGLTMENVWLSK